MGYSGARLASLCHPEPSRITAFQMAKRGSEELLRATVQNTPIDDSPFPSRDPGTARRSWRVKPISIPLPSIREDVYHGGIETEDKVAFFLEYGTGLYGPEHRPYYIYPKDPSGHLTFYSRKLGRWITARRVLHPGIHPQRPLATGVALTEHTLSEVLSPLLKEWVNLMEAVARTAPKV